jgi:hypothetical protein
MNEKTKCSVIFLSIFVRQFMQIPQLILGFLKAFFISPTGIFWLLVVFQFITGSGSFLLFALKLIHNEIIIKYFLLPIVYSNIDYGYVFRFFHLCGIFLPIPVTLNIDRYCIKKSNHLAPKTHMLITSLRFPAFLFPMLFVIFSFLTFLGSKIHFGSFFSIISNILMNLFIFLNSRWIASIDADSALYIFNYICFICSICFIVSLISTRFSDISLFPILIGVYQMCISAIFPVYIMVIAIIIYDKLFICRPVLRRKYRVNM